MRIVFMGTPDFAVPSLDILVRNGFEIAGVITATDKLGGRGNNKLIESAIKKYAIKLGLKVLQPRNLKSPEFISDLSALKADLHIIVAFRMLPEIVWNMPPLGTYNLHGSLLPKYRGAAPIHWAVIRGETKTGVTSFKLRHEIDTGDVLLQRSMPIYFTDTTGDVHDRMSFLGAEVILQTVKIIRDGNPEFHKQDESLVSKAPKINTGMCEIDFHRECRVVYNQIRGLSPYPGAWTTLDGKNLKIYNAWFEIYPHTLKPGTFDSDGKNQLRVATIDGHILIRELQLEGKRKMDVKEFLKGHQNII